MNINLLSICIILITTICFADPVGLVSVQNGEIKPEGYVSTVSNLIEAVTTVQAGLVQQQATAAAANLISNELAEIRELETARNATGYIRGFVESFSAGIQADTNMTASIIAFEYGGNDTTNAFWNLFTYFTEDPGVWPVVTTSDSVGRTNSWDIATSTGVCITNKVVDSTEYECYCNTISMPIDSTSHFFRVQADISGVGTNQTYFPVTGGVSVNGNDGLTITVIDGAVTNKWIGGVRVQP